MILYRRCKQWKCLPSDGGLMNQDERLMSLLDIVDIEVDRWRAKRTEDERNNIVKENMAAQMKGSRHA